MTNHPTYACENFGVAVHCLATGPGEIKTRLLSAFLSISCLTSRDIPEEMQPQFNRLRSLLTDVGPQNDIGKVSGRLRYMRKDKATQIAELFLSIHMQLTQMCLADSYGLTQQA
ncbi:MAG: hypothetical protein ACOYYS_13305 [Chloroflexota bacterium]